MHAIITCTTTAPNFVDAGRQPLAAIHNLPAKTIQIDCADDATGSLCVQDIEDMPVAMSPVPPTLKRVKAVNRREGLAMLKRRKAHLAQEEIADSLPIAGLAQASSLKRVRTVNKLEGLGMLERRNALLTERESGSLSQASSLKRVRTINRLDGLAKLERRKAHITGEDFTIVFPLTGAVYASTLRRVRTITKSAGLAMLGRHSVEDASSLVIAGSEASTLKRVRTINKRAGLKILECRKARFFEHTSIQAHSAAAQKAQASP
ncbi:hypothetical protein AX14_002952 [Amanita brunnescens Koide BX004]|nr:hypothetical protein AX14_002952 [Amanita brunnescens Koide BX004]